MKPETREPENLDLRLETQTEDLENQLWSQETLQEIFKPWSPDSSKTTVRNMVKDIVSDLVRDLVRNRSGEREREKEIRDPRTETQRTKSGALKSSRKC